MSRGLDVSKEELLTSRREVLKAGLAAGASILLGGSVRAVDVPKLGSRVVVVHGKDCEKMVSRAFDLLGGIQKFVFPGSKVIVKPNASFANPASWANNTNPEILAACCNLIKKAGARKIVVLDYPLMRGAEALQLNGIAPIIKGQSGVSLSVLEKVEQFRVIKPVGCKVLKEVAIAREVLDADLVVNLPVAKAHDAVAASIGLKNLMGVIWDRTSFHTMFEINQAIADLAQVVKPGLTLVDMTRIMVTNGPKGPGEIATPNLLVASTDPVAADSYCLSQTRFNHRMFRPKQLRYLVYAHAASLGEIDLSKVNVVKENV